MSFIRRGDLTEGFLRYRFRGLMFGEAYFRNFTVYRLFTVSYFFILFFIFYFIILPHTMSYKQNKNDNK